jgi:anti-sigma regulatory factor (Ser/Thr protein kinase)
MSALRSQTRSRDFRGSIEAAKDAEAWVVEECASLGLAARVEFAIGLCLEELFVNAVMHGRAGKATISIWTESERARVEFVDDGDPFDPCCAPVKRIQGPTDDFDIGGYGAGLLRKFARSMSYRREGQFNRVALEFDEDMAADQITLSAT